MDDLRQDLLDAALPLLLERGVHAVTIEEIAAVARRPIADATALFATTGALANEL